MRPADGVLRQVWNRFDGAQFGIIRYLLTSVLDMSPAVGVLRQVWNRSRKDRQVGNPTQPSESTNK